MSTATYVPRHPWRAALRSAALGSLVFGFVGALGILGEYVWLVPIIVVLLYARGVWRFYANRGRLAVVVRQNKIEGPGSTRWSARITLNRRRLDKERSRKPSIVEHVLGYRNLYDKAGKSITIDTILLGPQQTRELLRTLKIE